MSLSVAVGVPGNPYRVVVCDLASWEALDLPEARERGRRAVLVTDENVARFWLDPVERSLRRVGWQAESIVLPAGEATKDFDHLSRVLECLCRIGVHRDGWVVALGGGVVGDLAGFAAACYLRGIALVQIPTSLLAMADSSVGGKVGINFGGGKNLVGAFHQPRLVITSPSFLTTLPDEEFANGMAEVIKTGLIGDAVLFERLEEAPQALWRRDPGAIEEVVARSVGFKASIVARDEREAGERRLLNFGHTIGHAIEAAGGFRLYRHGEAVAIGMVAATHLSIRLGVAQTSLLRRLLDLLAAYRLPVRAEGLTWDDLAPWLDHDKKAMEDGWTFVLTGDIGDARVRQQVSEASVREAAQHILG